MFKKNCHYCGKDSYSSYNDPEWYCPYCGERMSYPEGEEGANVNWSDIAGVQELKIVPNNDKK